MHENLSKLVGVAITLIIFLKFITKDITNVFYFDNEVKDILVNISLSYIAAYIFYYLQIYIPEKRKSEKLKSVLAFPLNQIQREIKSLLKNFNNEIHFYSIDNEIEGKFNDSMSKIIMNASTETIIEIVEGKVRFASYLELINIKEANIKKIVEQTLILQPDSLDLKIILNSVLKSEIFESAKYALYFEKMSIPCNVNGTVYVEHCVDLYLIYWKVNDYMIKNKIKVDSI